MDIYEQRRQAHLDEVRRAAHRHAGVCAASHESAAIAWGLLVFKVPEQAQLTRIGGHRRNERTRAVCAEVTPDDLCMVGDLLVTRMARTVVDIARARRFVPALVTADAALRRGVRREELGAVISRMHRWPGVKNARLVAQEANHLAESAGESIVRGRSVVLGFPRPRLQYEVTDAHGRTRFYDLYWEQHALAGEFDGLVKYVDDPEAILAEKEREELLADDVTFIRWNYRQALAPDHIFEPRLRAAMRRGDRLIIARSLM